jgi:hypothetical protein
MNPVKRLAADAIRAVSRDSLALRRAMNGLGLRPPCTRYGGRVGAFAAPNRRRMKLAHLELKAMTQPFARDLAPMLQRAPLQN